MSALDRLLQTSGVVVRREEPSAAAAVPRVFLHAGQVLVPREPAEITTILGSCVAIGLWDAVASVGGMNHYMLPRDVGDAYATPRYATYATNLLFEQLQAAGAEPRRLRARIFGGACILNSASTLHHDLGSQNVRAARELLAARRIPVVEEQTGGMHGRKVIFQTSTGDATVLQVNRVIP